MTQNIDCALGASLTGAPLSKSALAAIQDAMQGGEPTATYFHNQFEVYNFTNWLNTEGDDAWIESTDKEGNPVIWAAQVGSTGGERAGKRARSLQESNSMSMILRTVPDHAVLNGTKTAEGFTWNGKDYNIVGSLTMTLSYDLQSMWQVTVPLGVVEAIPMTLLLKVGWQGLVKPLLLGLLKGVKYCFNAARALASGGDVAETAALAGEDAAVDGVEVATETTVSMAAGAAAMVGGLVLIAIPFILEMIAHPVYHSVKLYNLTPYDITWNDPYLNEGVINMAPSTGIGKGFNYKIPAQSMFSPDPNIDPVLVSHEADFNFASGSEYHGLGYAMSFTLTDPKNNNANIGTAAMMFSVPWAGDNSLCVTSPQPGDLSTFYTSNDGVHQDTKMDATLVGKLMLTATYDYLNGKHPTPSGQTAYTYNSLVVFYLNN